MAEFIESVRQSHPFFAKESLSAEIELQNQTGYLGSQDWVVRSTPFYTHQEPVGSGIGVPSEIDQFSADMAVEKVIWNTGGRLSAAWTSTYTDQTISDIVIPMPTGDVVIPVGPSRFYQNKVYLTYTQPLLQNRGGRLDRLNYELSSFTAEILRVQSQENQEGFILDLADGFLSWCLLAEQNRIAIERLRLAEEQLSEVRRMRAANLVDQIDVLRAEDAVNLARQSIVLVESQYRARQVELAVLAQSKRLDNSKPSFDLYRLDSLPEADEAVAAILERSRILKVLRSRREQLNRLVNGYQETKMPQLNLSVGAGLQGGQEEFSESFDLDKPDILLALDFRYPLGNRSARANITKTELEIRQLDDDIKNIELRLESGIRNLLTLIDKTKDVLELNQEQIESAQAKTEEEIRLYNQGRNLLTFVIQSRDNEEQAKLTYAENAATYHKMVLQYRALMDELLTP